MLITFRVANFLSFNDEIEFSMLAGQQRLLPTHALTFGKGRDSIDILKTAVIYGANASGKSNLIKAMDFARKIIVNGIKSETTYNKHFRLDTENSHKPSKFEFEFKIEEKMYAYGFSMLLETKKVLSEWLFDVNKNNDTPIFEREVLDSGQSVISFNLKLDKKGKNRFEVYQEDILDTQLFLTELNEKNLKDIKGAEVFNAIFNWFNTHLMILKGHDLDSMLLSLSGFIHFNNQDLEKYFTLFNTGITKIAHKELPIEQIDWAIKTFNLDKFIDTLKNSKTISENAIFPFVFWFDGKQQRFAFSKTQKGEIKMTQLVALANLKESKKKQSNLICKICQMGHNGF